jgi:hypothetical protein
MTQHCFPGLRPTKPTIRTPSVARRIAERIVAEVNLDEFYWESEKIPERVEDVAAEIVRCGHPATVFHRLHRAERKADPEIGGGIYGWEGIEEHCEHIADEIAAEELAAAVERHRREYGE